MKNIRLFEAFAGIGSQYQALKNISKKKKWNIEQVGIIEWFIPAIIAYQAIHHMPKKIEKQSFKYNFVLSNDSKNSISKNSLLNMQNNKTEQNFWLNQSKEVSNNLFDISQVGGGLYLKILIFLLTLFLVKIFQIKVNKKVLKLTQTQEVVYYDK